MLCAHLLLPSGDSECICHLVTYVHVIRKGPSHPMTLNFVLEHCVIICKAAISVIRIYHTFPCTLRLSGSEAKIQISLNTT